MFFVLSKVLAFLSSPLIWIVGLLIWSLLTKAQKRKRKLLIGGLLTLYITSNPLVFNLSLFLWEEIPSKVTERYDAAIVLLGFTDLKQLPDDRVHVSQSVNRITQLVPLYKGGVIDKILLSGGTPSIAKMNKTEADEVALLLLSWGVDEEDILIDNKSRNTRENIINAKVILDKQGLKRTLLVSSGYHLKRAMACAKKQSLNCTPYATDFRKIIVPSWVYYLIPTSNAFRGIEILIHEWVGYTSYWLLGYL